MKILKIITIFIIIIIFIFEAKKNLCILHGRGFVMNYNGTYHVSCTRAGHCAHLKHTRQNNYSYMAQHHLLICMVRHLTHMYGATPVNQRTNGPDIAHLRFCL